MPDKPAGAAPAAPIDPDTTTSAERARLVSAVLDLVADGSTYRNACVTLGIPRPTVWRWMQADPGALDRYAIARESNARQMADETLEISDAATNEGERVARLRVDTRKWLASKLLPREFGDRIELTGTFANLDLRQLTDDQIRRLSDGEAPASVLVATIPRALPATVPLPNEVAADDEDGA